MMVSDVLFAVIIQVMTAAVLFRTVLTVIEEPGIVTHKPVAIRPVHHDIIMIQVFVLTVDSRRITGLQRSVLINPVRRISRQGALIVDIIKTM